MVFEAVEQLAAHTPKPAWIHCNDGGTRQWGLGRKAYQPPIRYVVGHEPARQHAHAEPGQCSRERRVQVVCNEAHVEAELRDVERATAEHGRKTPEVCESRGHRALREEAWRCDDPLW